MLITALEITDYKRVRNVAITPASDTHVILLGGKNRQGKSSTLDALSAAFGGAKQLAADPVRHGADEAAIYIELDGGKLTISRTIDPDGATKLEVRNEDGAVRSPQAMLDKLIGGRFMDPLIFLQLPAKEQRAQLMKLIPDAARIDELGAKRLRAFDRRTELGRDLVKAKGELDRLPEMRADAPLDIAALTEKARAFAEQQRAGDGLGASHRIAVNARELAELDRHQSKKRIAEFEEQLRSIQRQIEKHQGEVAASEQRIAACLATEAEAKKKLDDAVALWASTTIHRAELDADLARAGEHNRKVVEAETQMKRRAEASAAAAKLDADYKLCTEALETIDKRKAEILAAAKLPVEGLTITDDGIALGGVPFEQASDAEKWRTALGLAITASPGLNDVWIRDGALLDDESLEQVAKHAAAAGKRVWIERVGTKDPGVIVIQDGQVAS